MKSAIFFNLSKKRELFSEHKAQKIPEQGLRELRKSLYKYCSLFLTMAYKTIIKHIKDNVLKKINQLTTALYNIFQDKLIEKEKKWRQENELILCYLQPHHNDSD